LEAGDVAAGDGFGLRMAVNDVWAVVTSYEADATGVDSGAAYVFRREGDAWVEDTKLVGAGTAADAWFGSDVALVDDVLVVAAAGASQTAHVFRLDAGQWTEVQTLRPRNGASELYSQAVGAAPGRLYVSSLDLATAAGDGDGVYTFEPLGSEWRLTEALTLGPGPRHRNLGKSIAADGERVVAGADGPDLTTERGGAVYLFERSSGVWTQQPIRSVDPLIPSGFGRAVAIDGDDVVIGASAYDEGSGRTFVYQLGAGGVVREMELVGHDTQRSDRLGHRVAVHDGRALVGAPFAGETGAAYVFRRSDAL
jgi:hypothetical protein